jgi:hypothetical protein
LRKGEGQHWCRRKKHLPLTGEYHVLPREMYPPGVLSLSLSLGPPSHLLLLLLLQCFHTPTTTHYLELTKGFIILMILLETDFVFNFLLWKISKTT